MTSTSEATTLAPKVLDAAQNAPAADKLKVEGMISAEAATAGEFDASCARQTRIPE